MKIAVVTPYFPIAGMPYRGHSTYQTMRHLVRLADVEVIAPIAIYPRWLQPTSYRYMPADPNYSPPGVGVRYRFYRSIPVLTRPCNGWFCRRSFQRDLDVIRPDVILNYYLYPEGYAAVIAGRRLAVPVVVCALGSDLRRISDPVTRWFTRRTLREASFVLAVSSELRDRAIAFGSHPGRTRTILNGSDSSIFHPRSQAETRRALGVDPDAQVVLYVGSLIPTKGLAELVDAVAALTPNHPRLQVVCVGEGGFQETMSRKIAAAGLSSVFHFPGRADSEGVARWMAACDVFCLPSYSEGCPNAVVEALACGRPVVATDVGGIPELVDQSRGLLVPPRQVGPLAGALEESLGRAWDTSAIAAQSSRGWERVAAETFAVCESVIRSRQP